MPPPTFAVSVLYLVVRLAALCTFFLSSSTGMAARVAMGKPGSECRSDRDCAKSTFCDHLVRTCIRKPRSPGPGRKNPKKRELPHLMKRGDVGRKCEDDSSCAADLYCSSEKYVCVRKAKVGEICESAEHCVAELKCGAEGLCTSVSGDVGSVCSDAADCGDNLQCFVVAEKGNNGTVTATGTVAPKRCATPCIDEKECAEKQACKRGMCIGKNYGPCMPTCDHGLQCNRVTNKCRPKTSVIEKCNDDGKAACVKECLKFDQRNPDRIIYCGFCCLKGCRCFNGPGWLKLVSSEFLSTALGSYNTYNMSVAGG